MKDQKKLVSRCIENEIPCMVLTGNDALALETMEFYYEKAKEKGCHPEFTNDLKFLVKHFRDHRKNYPEQIKTPD